jgi:hypothetical protein
MIMNFLRFATSEKGKIVVAGSAEPDWSEKIKNEFFVKATDRMLRATKQVNNSLIRNLIMKIFSKKLVVRNGSLRLVAVLCCLIGVFAVMGLRAESNLASFSVFVLPEPPNMEIENIEERIMKSILESRDLSDYDPGGSISDCKHLDANEYRRCERSTDSGREFIYRHLINKKRGYLVYHWTGADVFGERHIFIEPDENRNWRIIIRWDVITQDLGLGSYYEIDSIEAVRVERRRITENDDRPRAGTFYLIFLDQEGEEAFDL